MQSLSCGMQQRWLMASRAIRIAQWLHCMRLARFTALYLQRSSHSTQTVWSSGLGTLEF